MSLQRAYSAGNLNILTFNTKSSTNDKTLTGKFLDMSKQVSNVSDFLSVSSVKEAKQTRGDIARNKYLKENKGKLKVVQSSNMLHPKSSEVKSRQARPALSMKEPLDDTPRTHNSTSNSIKMPIRPSVDDFLNVHDEPKTNVDEINPPSQHGKDLLEYVSSDTKRSSSLKREHILVGDHPSPVETIDTLKNTKTSRNDVLINSSNTFSDCKNELRNTQFLVDNDDINCWSNLTSDDNMKKQKFTSKDFSNTFNSSNAQAVKDSKTITSNRSAFENVNQQNIKLENTNISLFQNSMKREIGHVTNKTKCRWFSSKNDAAKYIQTWWRRALIRNKAGCVAMQKIMESKRRQLEKMICDDRKQDYDRQVKEYEVIKKKEDKARDARQKIINEMYNKRSTDKKVKILKTNSLNTDGVKISEKNKNNSGQEEDFPNSILENKDVTASSIRKKVNEIFESSSRDCNSPRPIYIMGENKDSAFGNLTHLDIDNELSAVMPDNTQNSKKTLDDLFITLQELEEESITKFSSSGLRCSEITGTSKAALKSEEQLLSRPLLSADKLKAILNFLDEVEKVEDDVRSEFLGQSKEFDRLHGYDEQINSQGYVINDCASQVAKEISNAITAQKLEIDAKSKSVEMMKKAIIQQKEFTTMQMKEMDKEHKQQILVQRQEYEATIQRHLSFIDQLIEDKKVLTKKCEEFVAKLKDTDQKYIAKIKQLTENHAVELKKQKEMSEAADKLRREKWIKEKTHEIKEMTVKGLEPDIQKLIAKHKAEITKIKAMKQGEILETDERVGRKYIQQIEDLRVELEKEKEAAVKKEREAARLRYEGQLREEEHGYQQQRRRLYAEIESEKERLNEQIENMKKSFDERKSEYETSSKQTLASTINGCEKQISELKRSHEVEMRNYKEQVDIEKQQWIENYMKKQEAHLLTKERELKESVRDARDKEIEMVITRLEQETAGNKEEAERAAENRIKRIRDKYEKEIIELENSERNMHDKYNALKECCEGLENQCIQMRSEMKIKHQELEDLKKLTNRLQDERGKVSDIIRQEFADRLIFLEEESSRLRNELQEEKSRHRFAVERVAKDKEHEMEEVHQRVKKAIMKKEETTQMLRQQLLAAEKRAEHLEQLLAEQRKKILET